MLSPFTAAAFCLLWTVSSVAFGWTIPLRVQRRQPPLLRSSELFETGRENDEGGSTIPPSTVGDYVKGVHGGKYQFEAPGMGMSSAGMEFAEALYSSSGGLEEETDDGADEVLPRWAYNMGSSGVTDEDCLDTLMLPRSGEPLTVRITNQERTWEAFHVNVVGGDGSLLPSEGFVQFAPAKGKLAPRGGASNLCDPNRPYSDSATIQIRFSPGARDRALPLECFLLIATEEEKWYYKLLMY